MTRTITLVAVPLAGVALVYGCSSSSVAESADAGSDASMLDVVHSVHPPPADDFDSGADENTSTCPRPADISWWTPAASVPAKKVPGACSAADLAAYDAACFAASTATDAACMAFQAANATCASCVESSSTDTAWGPLVNWSGVAELNIGGCLQLVAPSEAACALAVQTADACPHAACDAVCPVSASDGASFDEWQKCAGAADADACAPFVSLSSCLADDDAATGTVCNAAASSGATFDSAFLLIAPIFCGGADGGSGEAGVGEAGAAEAGPGEAGGPDSSPADAAGQ